MDSETFCEGCDRDTRTVLGKCSNCWYVKNAAAVLAPRRDRPLLWDGEDLVSSLWGWLLVTPGVAVLAFGIVLGVPALTLTGGALLAVSLLGLVVAGGTFW